MINNRVFKCVLALVLVLALIIALSVYALAEETTDKSPVFVTQGTTAVNEETVEYEDKTPFAAAKSELSNVDVWGDLGSQSVPKQDGSSDKASFDKVGIIVPLVILAVCWMTFIITKVIKNKKEN